MANITARDLAHSVGLRITHEYYKGRGARIIDLNGEKLANIHQKIKAELGDEPAKAFVTMVQNIKSLSARRFLESFYALEKNGWEYSEEIQREINEREENYRNLDAIYAYHASLRDDTNVIRRSFLAYIDEKYDYRFMRFENYMRMVSESRDNFYGDVSSDDDDDDNAEYE